MCFQTTKINGCERPDSPMRQGEFSRGGGDGRSERNEEKRALKTSPPSLRTEGLYVTGVFCPRACGKGGRGRATGVCLTPGETPSGMNL